jgi:hypothetical protein
MRDNLNNMLETDTFRYHLNICLRASWILIVPQAMKYALVQKGRFYHPKQVQKTGLKKNGKLLIPSQIGG